MRAHNSQRKTEILVVTPTYSSIESGAGQVVKELITVMARRAPFHFTWAAHDDHEGERILPDMTAPGEAPPTILPMQGWLFFEKIFRLRWPVWNKLSRKLLRHAIVDTDIVWIHDTLYLGAWVAFRRARAIGRPIFITQHNTPVLYAEQSSPWQRAWIHFVDRIITRPMLRKAQQVTFTSHVAARFYQERVSFRNAVRVVPNGVDAQIFHPPSADDYRGLRTRFSLRDDQPVLLFSGRFEKVGGLLALRRIAEALPK